MATRKQIIRKALQHTPKYGGKKNGRPMVKGTGIGRGKPINGRKYL